MKINNNIDKNYPSNLGSKPKEKTDEKKDQSTKIIQDEYTPSQEDTKKTTYNKPKSQVDEKTIQRLKEESDRTYSNLREMVKELLERQGMTFKDIDNPEAVVKVDEEARLEAQSMISDGGPLSPEVVSDRIIEFAKAISGGDKEKFETIKSAIDEGFKEAERILGGELPEISQKTYEMVMEKLDRWAEEE